jgi:hypothetical protein
MTSVNLAHTREAWHRVAEHVLAAAEYAETGEIRLRPAPGGFATAHGRRLRVAGDQLVVEDGRRTRTAALTTVGAAAEFAGIVPGMPAQVYPPATPLEPDEPLFIDAESARVLAGWYELADEALRRFAAESGCPQEPTLWPEHFDLGITVEATNYGASPGDGEIAQPYVYAGPHDGPPRRDAFWNASFGAARGIDVIPNADAVLAFFRDARSRLPDNFLTDHETRSASS